MFRSKCTLMKELPVEHRRNNLYRCTVHSVVYLIKTPTNAYIYCPKYEHGEWKSRTNRELQEMSKGENTVQWIKGQRISQLGHLERMEEDRMPKKIFAQELEGTRRRGKTQEKMERGSRKRSSSAGSEKMERVGGR